MPVAVDKIAVRRVAGNIGAEISGVRVGPDLPEPVVRQIREALLEHKVVFFRGQYGLDDVGMAGFAKLFGELQPHRRKSVTDAPEGKFVHGLDSAKTRATVWHTDATLTLRPPDLTLLRTVELPPYGGDTAWANTAAAYQRMGPDWQQLADSLRVIHTNNMAGRQLLRAEAARQSAEGKERTLPEAMADPRRAADSLPKRLFETEHPLVRVHPETSERCLLLGAFAKTILGRDDSDTLINLFQAYITALDNTLRWQWELGDMAMWDNRSTQHCGISNYGGHKRRLSRCTVAGTVPVGVDGRPSIAHASPE
jgi:alpha-ketoglutarate-dependent sulfate ester dioxygenase